MKNQTELGKQVQAYMDRGELVPDDLTIAMVRGAAFAGRIARAGAILDGFPRTPAQAGALSSILGERARPMSMWFRS